MDTLTYHTLKIFIDLVQHDINKMKKKLKILNPTYQMENKKKWNILPNEGT